MNMDMLRMEIDAAGLSMTKVAERSTVPRATLYYRLEHPETWTVNEMIGVCKALKLTVIKRRAIFGI